MMRKRQQSALPAAAPWRPITRRAFAALLGGGAVALIDPTPHSLDRSAAHPGEAGGIDRKSPSAAAGPQVAATRWIGHC